MLFSLPGPNTETELARGDPGEVAEEAGRDPAGRGKQAAVIFTLLRLQGFHTAALQRQEFPLVLAPGQGHSDPLEAHRGAMETPTWQWGVVKTQWPSSMGCLPFEKGKFVRAAAQGGQRPSPQPQAVKALTLARRTSSVLNAEGSAHFILNESA